MRVASLMTRTQTANPRCTCRTSSTLAELRQKLHYIDSYCPSAAWRLSISEKAASAPAS